MISLGREKVKPVFSECAAKCIQRVIIISQGSADADERGKELQRQLVAVAREHGIRIIGPNTMGILNDFSNFGSVFVDIPKESPPSPLSVVAHPGHERQVNPNVVDLHPEKMRQSSSHVAARRLGQDEAYLTVREILSEASTAADRALWQESSDSSRCGCATLGLT